MTIDKLELVTLLMSEFTFICIRGNSYCFIIKAGILKNYFTSVIDTIISRFLSPRHYVSSGSGWRIDLQYGM